MSRRHRETSYHQTTNRRSRTNDANINDHVRERNSDFERVRIKEEPVSDIEDTRRHHKRSQEIIGADRHHRHNNNRHSEDEEEQRRERGREEPRTRRRDDSSRDDERRSNNSGRRRSRSRSPNRRNLDHERSNNSELNNMREIPHERNKERRGRNRDLDSNGRIRDPVREDEWSNFFHPDTVTSSSVKIKKELTEHEKYGIRPSVDQEDDDAKKVEKEKPNFGLSGKLAAETNTFRGVVIKYSEPPEARKPLKIRWRLYPFKEDESLPVMYIHRQSAYLLGRDRKIADIPIDHPSCSKQHAAIQYRLMPYERSNGTKGRRIKPYIIDLESANGTLVNNCKIEPKRYVELFERDALKFGFSSREYILLHENSKDDPDDDEVGAESASPLPAIKKEKKPNLGNES